jgi:hypothetical protein
METNWSRNKIDRIFLVGKIGIMLFIPIALFLIPINYLDNAPTICLIKNISGYECFGCGMTHAIISTFNGHFEKAFLYNWKIIIILPLLAIIWGKQLIKLIKEL